MCGIYSGEELVSEAEKQISSVKYALSENRKVKPDKL